MNNIGLFHLKIDLGDIENQFIEIQNSFFSSKLIKNIVIELLLQIKELGIIFDLTAIQTTYFAERNSHFL